MQHALLLPQLGGKMQDDTDAEEASAYHSAWRNAGKIETREERCKLWIGGKLPQQWVAPQDMHLPDTNPRDKQLAEFHGENAIRLCHLGMLSSILPGTIMMLNTRVASGLRDHSMLTCHIVLLIPRVKERVMIQVILRLHQSDPQRPQQHLQSHPPDRKHMAVIQTHTELPTSNTDDTTVQAKSMPAARRMTRVVPQPGGGSAFFPPEQDEEIAAAIEASALLLCSTRLLDKVTRDTLAAVIQVVEGHIEEANV
eukprot:1563321-Amphidinium_carterae.5